MNPQKLGRACLPVILLATLTVPVWALTDEEVFKNFRFNFNNPGARALGLGGAFIAAADDATAAQANPAALHYVDRFEVFAEYRSVQGNVEIAKDSTGSLSDLSGTSTYLDIQTVTNRGDTNFLSFASFVFPFRVANHRARVAVSRQTVLDVSNSLQTDDGSALTQLRFSATDYPPWVNPATGDVERYTVENTVNPGELEAEIVHYNLGLEYSLAKDFSLGVTATYATLDMTSNLVSVTNDPRGILVSVNPRIVTGSGDFLPLLDHSTINGTDNAWAYTVGIHWHPDEVFTTPSGLSPIRFGLVYRKGAEFGVAEVFQQCSLDTAGAPVSCASETIQNVIKEPDRFGFGASYHTPRHWVLALEAERIKFSDLLKDYQAGRNFFTNGRIQVPSSDPSQPPIAIDQTKVKYTVDDATVFRGGGEFRSQTRGGWGYALRAGYYRAPDNRIRLEEVNSGDAQVDALYKNVFGAGKAQDHFTAGFTLNIKGGFALQAAGDFSNVGDQYLLSGIYRFGKSR